MANTYYDSQLTAAEIEAALEAIDGVIVPANNGKVLAINNGKLEARSVQWGGGSAVVQPLSVTQNGTYNPPSGVDGYAPVTVNVSGGGGVDWAGLFSFYTRRENSMSWTKDLSYLQSVWSGGGNIGADSWIGFDATNINTISVDVETGTSYSDTTPKWYVFLALMSTDPATINFPANNYQTYFLVYDEFHTRNSSDTLTIDVSNYTGLNYIVLSPVGWNAKFTNLRFN